VEVASALRKGLLSRQMTEKRAAEALADYRDLPMTRYGVEPLLDRLLALRENFSAYDACYVALAERLEASLLTADERLARAARSVLGRAVLQ
jgi:predicted nucleic acid-binding protein